MQVWLVPPDMVSGVWLAAISWLRPALDRSSGDHTAATAFRCTVDGEYQLWLIHEAGAVKAAGLTMIAQYPTGQRWLELMFAGGQESHLWGDQGLAAMESFAAANGCKGVRIYGRRGWLRRLSGLTEAATIFEKVT